VVQVNIPSIEERRRQAQDLEKFLGNTYVMHLGM
jgi:hypothetical protein